MLSKASFSHFYRFFFFFWFIMLTFIILQPVTSESKLAGNAPSKIGVKRSPLPMAHSVTAGGGHSSPTPVTYQRGISYKPLQLPKRACTIYNRCRQAQPSPPSPPSPPANACTIYNRCRRAQPSPPSPPPPPPPSP
ncbi:hypothetical protein CsSME_00019181 [Camellia sinensis var. sinensis]